MMATETQQPAVATPAAVGIWSQIDWNELNLILKADEQALERLEGEAEKEE